MIKSTTIPTAVWSCLLEKPSVIGYGSQGHAHAKIYESGVNVVVGLRRDSASWGRPNPPV